MKLQYKVMLILAGIWAIVSVIFFVDSKYILHRSYTELERNLISSDVKSVDRAFDRSLKALSLYALAWAQWDDAYQFMADKNQKFITSNFNVGTFTSSKINFFLFFDQQGKYFYGGLYDDKQEKMAPVPGNLITYLENHQEFVHLEQPGQSNTGVLNTPEGLIVMTSQPVIKGDASGPVRGSLLMGYYLNQTIFSTYNEMVDGQIEFYRFPVKGLALQEANSMLNQGKDYYIHYDGDAIAKGYVYLKDFDGHPVGIIQYMTMRNIYQQGIATIQHYLIFMGTLAILIAFLMWFLLKRWVLDRILNVSQQVVDINKNSDFSHRIVVNGHDEISKMVDYLNNMMNMIVVSQYKLEYMAHHDDLTGLPNRLSFQKDVTKAILQSKQNAKKIALIFLDVNHFKVINDQYGHSVGDGLLQHVATVLVQLKDEQAIISRLAGDEFLIAMCAFENSEAIKQYIAQVNQELGRPVCIENQIIQVTISAGVSIYPDDAEHLDVLIKLADKSMYAAKSDPNKAYYFYEQLSSAKEKEPV